MNFEHLIFNYWDNKDLALCFLHYIHDSMLSFRSSAQKKKMLPRRRLFVFSLKQNNVSEFYFINELLILSIFF